MPDISSVAPYSVTQQQLNGYTTESNPFIPTYYDDLLAAIQTPGIYVKITDDFDFKNSDGTGVGDSGWRDGFSMSSSLTIKCRKLFADDKPNNGGKYRISGLNSGKADYLLTSSSNEAYSHTIENISFINCVTYCNVGDSCVFKGFNANSTIVFNNCQISMLIICTIYPPALNSTNVYCNNCSIYIKTSMSNFIGTGAPFLLWNTDQCTVQVSGLRFITTYPQAINGIFGNASNSTFYADVSLKYGYDNIVLSNMFHCCVVLNASWDASSSYTTVPLTFQNISGVNVFDSTLLDAANITKTVNGSAAYLTTTQMKDETSLINAGFLP